MKFTGRERTTLVVYGLIIVLILLAVGGSGRDVLFDRMTARRSPTVVSDGSTIFVAGGRTSDGDVYGSLEIVELDSGRILVRHGIDAAPIGFSLVATADGVLIIGGNADRSYSDAIYRVNHGSGRVSRIGTLPFPVAFADAVSVGSMVYQFGGYDGTARRGEIVEIDPRTGVSTIVGAIDEPRDNLKAIAVSERVFILGGDTSDSVSRNDLVEIDVPTGRTVARWDLPLAVTAPTIAFLRDTICVLASTSGNRNTLLTLDLSGGNPIVLVRPTTLDARALALVAARDRLYAVGGSSPDAARQLGVWELAADLREASPIKLHSRVWY